MPKGIGYGKAAEQKLTKQLKKVKAVQAKKAKGGKKK